MVLPISPTLHVSASQWRHLLRATLRECTYLPDPIARVYMRDYVLDRYRRAMHSEQPVYKLVRIARYQLYRLQRANEGYLQPLEKVLLMSYGRVGRRRHELLASWISPNEPEIPKVEDKDSLGGSLKRSRSRFSDDWKPPAMLLVFLKAQKNDGTITSSKIRPQVKSLEPSIPEKNSWHRPMPLCRKVNMRRRWYTHALGSVLPPLPDHEVKKLDGLASGAIPWSPVPRRPRRPSPESENTPSISDNLLDFLVDGPQKGHTFAPYVNGRPHIIDHRFMRRLWRRISCHVPRMTWNEQFSKWTISYDTPKDQPQVAFEVYGDVDLVEIFGDSVGKENATNTRPTQI